MKKISQAQRDEVLSEVPTILRKVAEERDFYKTAFLKQASRDRVVKLAEAMVEKGLRSGSPEDIADELQKSAQDGDIDLAVTERAVELVGPDMGKHASVSDAFSGGTTDLERYLMSS